MIRVPTTGSILLPVNTYKEASQVLFDQAWINDHAHLQKDRRDSAMLAVLNPHIEACGWTFADVKAIKSDVRARMANRRSNVSIQEKQGEKIGHAIKRYVVLYQHFLKYNWVFIIEPSWKRCKSWLFLLLILLLRLLLY
jgi:hypothetical protein